MIFAVVLWIASGWVGAGCGWERGHGVAGMVLGLTLGPLGWLIADRLPLTATVRDERHAHRR